MNEDNLNNTGSQSGKSATVSDISAALPPTSKPISSNFKFPIIMILLIIAFLGGLALSAWYFQSQLQKMNLVKPEVKTVEAQPKILIIGTDATDPPMEYVNKEGGLVGYDIDLGYRIANEIGIKAEFKNIKWDNIFNDLLSKKIDMIICSVTITDERKQKYAFSTPYINVGQVLVSRINNPVTSISELKGKKISVQKGTTNEKEALKLTSPDFVLSYDDITDAAKMLSEGNSDVMISDLVLAKGFMSKYSNIKITSDPFTNEYYGVVLRKEDTALLKKVNDALSVLRTNGILTNLKQKWLD